MAGRVTLGGLVSGMDTESVIQQLLALEQARIRTQQDRKAQLNAKQKAWRDIDTSLSKLRGKLDTLHFPFIYRSRTVTASSTDTAATMTAASGASLTTHTLSVGQLAQTHVLASGNYQSANSLLGITGTPTLSINGKNITLSDKETLNSLRDKINNISDIGLTASVAQVMLPGSTTPSYRLVMTSRQVGTAGAIKISSASSSDSEVVDPSGSTVPGTYDITVLNTAQGRIVTGDFVSDTTTYSGTFAVNGKTFDLGAGKTATQIADLINQAKIGVSASAALDASGSVKLTLTADAAVNNDIQFTADPNGVLQSLGLANADLSAKNETQAKVDAQYSVNGGPTFTSRANRILNAANVTGLNLKLEAAGTASVTVDGVDKQLGFVNSAGGYLHELSAAQDAVFTLDGVTYTKSSNVITDALPELSITLKRISTSAESYTVSQDADKVASAVQEWVDAYNSTMNLLQEKAKYDESTKVAGVLNGDYLVRNLQYSLRKMVSETVQGLPDAAPGMPETLRQLRQIGVSTGAWGSADYGKLVLDKEELKEKLLANEEGVSRLFGALRTNVAVGASVAASSTDPSGSFSADDVINGDSDSARFGSLGGGWQSQGIPDGTNKETLTLAFAETKMIDQLILNLPDSEGYPNSTQGLKDFVLEYLDPVQGWVEIESVTNHTGSSKTIDFEAKSADAIRLTVSATYGNSPARVSELRAYEVNSGVASRMYSYVHSNLAASTGALPGRTTTLDEQIEDLDARIKQMDERLTEYEEQLRAQFQRLEASLARIQSQGSSFMTMLNSGLQKG